MPPKSKTKSKSKSTSKTKSTTKSVLKANKKIVAGATVLGLAGLAAAYTKLSNPKLTLEQRQKNKQDLLAKIDKDLALINNELRKGYLPFSSRMQLQEEKHKLEEYKEQIEEEAEDKRTWYQYLFG